MSAQANKKSPRTFQCRQSLWQKFEQMAKELECSVDYLINDAMKQYARQRGYGPAATAGVDSTDGAAAGPPEAPPLPAPAVPRGTSGSVSRSSVPAPRAPGSGSFSGVMAPPPARSLGAAIPPPPATTSLRRPVPPPAGGRSLPPPPSLQHRVPAPGASARAAVPAARVAIRYKGQVFPVTKDRFIIGRGKQSSDLTIKDPNVSRQHAMIEFDKRQYYIVDLGSTNGVEYGGQRVQRKNIHHGDVFRVCDHELEFIFQ